MLAGIALVGAGLVTGAAPASAADPKGWGITGAIYYGGANGSGTIDYQVMLGATVTFTDPRCVGTTASFHPNAVMTTTIGSSTHASPPLSRWTTRTDSYPLTACHDQAGNLITGVTGTSVHTYGSWTLDYSCQLSGLAIIGTLTDPDAGLTDAGGFVRYNVENYGGLGAGSVLFDEGALPASCPAYPAPALTLSTPPAPYGAPARATVTVTGTGYVPGAAATIAFDTTPSNPVTVGSATVGPDGTFTADITIPADAVQQPHRVTVSSAGSYSRSVLLQVTPGLSVSPNSEGFGSSITVTGWNFPVGQHLSLALNAQDHRWSFGLGQTTAGADGSFTYTTAIPAGYGGFPAGPAWLTADGGYSNAAAPFTVLQRDEGQAMDAKAAAWGFGSATGPVSNFGDGGAYRTYQRGAVVDGHSQYLYISRDAIRTEWLALAPLYNGAQLPGRSVLGYPVSDEVAGLRDGGVYQLYGRGAIVWSPATGAHTSTGAIRTRYSQLGYENGVLGYPTTDEAGGLRGGGVYQLYQGGAIVWSPATGAHASLGGIRAEWGHLGYENGTMGYPTGEETGGLWGGGVYQMYQGGAIVWSPTTGAHESTGAIRTRYAQLGYETGILGYPTSDETGGLKGSGVYQLYQGGAVVWSPATGAHESTGPIRTAWQSTGSENGRLGYPTSNVYTVPNGTAQNFQGGKITYTNGTITVS
ncbi:LGFP repeat-containing protein [Sinomonas atrocyanea]